jgi:peptidoglycan/LPS O-acetylase OafA/YrhL
VRACRALQGTAGARRLPGTSGGTLTAAMDDRRYYGLDALRGGMMMLGIVLHAAWLYLAAPPPSMPMLTDRNNAFVFDVVFDFIHSFRMPTFFVLAGFFSALLTEKRGLWGTFKNRASRVLAPLAAGIVTILPVTGLLMLDFMLGARFGSHDLVPDGAALKMLGEEMAAKGVPLGRPMLGHLWFLYYLCFFYLLIPVCRFLVRQSLKFEDRLRRWLASPLLLAAFALYTAATLWPFQGGQVHEGFIYFKPHLPSLVYYGSFFVFGYAFHHYREFLKATAQNLALWAALSVALFPLSMYASHVDHGARGASVELHLGAVLANGLCTWALIYLLLGSALRFFDRASPWILYVSQSSYWVYLVHLPLVFLAGWWLLQFDLPAALKFLLVCAFTALTAFASFHYWVQKTWVSDFLHGRRFDLDWPWLESGLSRSQALRPGGDT